MANREVNYIISPTLGVLPEEVYNTVEDFARDVISIDDYVHDMRYKYGILIKGAATILAEYFNAIRSGEDIYNDLQEIGFKEPNALAAVKTLSVLDAAHHELINELCYNPDYAIYMMSLADKLKVVDFDYNTYQKWYALSKKHCVYPIKTVYIDEIFEPARSAVVCPITDEPTEDDALDDLMEVAPEAWRPFQVSYAVFCDTRPAVGTPLKRSLEFRGVTEAKTNVIGEGLQAVGAIEDLLEGYARHKGYEFILDDCKGLSTYFGLDTMDDRPYIIVEDPKTRETIIDLEVYDKDYGKTRFTDRVRVIGEWWLDAEELMRQMEKQAEKTTVWG